MFVYCNNNPPASLDPSGRVCILENDRRDYGNGCIEYTDYGTGNSSSCNNNNASAPDDFRVIDDENECGLRNCYSYAFDLPELFCSNPGIIAKGALPKALYKILYKKAYCSTTPSVSVLAVAYFVLLDMKAMNKKVRIIQSPNEALQGETVIALKTTNYLQSLSYNDYHFAVMLSDGKWADKPGSDPPRYNAISGYDATWPYSAESSYCSPTVFFAYGG